MNGDNKNMPFEIPASYFENSAEEFLAAALAAQAQQDSALTFSKNLPQDVPDGYFDALPQKLVAEISSIPDSESFLKSISNNAAKPETPNGYFDGLANEVISRINSTDEDVDTDTSFLDAIDKQMPFELPQGYFETLPATIQPHQTVEGAAAKLAPKPEMKLNRYKRSSKWTTSLAAAWVLMIFGLGATWMLSPDQNEGNSKQLAYAMLNAVSDEDIENYIENEIENFDVYSLMENASASNLDGNKSQIFDAENLLNDISSEDIDAYLIYEGI